MSVTEIPSIWVTVNTAPDLPKHTGFHWKTVLAIETSTEIIEEINKRFEKEFEVDEIACIVKANVRRYTPAILKALVINNNICRQEIQSIAQGIEEEHMKIAYGLLPTLLGEGSPQELDWYKQIKGKLHPLSLISSCVHNNVDRVEEATSVADALLLRLGVQLLLREFTYPKEFQRTFEVLVRLLFHIQPKPHNDHLTIYTIDRLIRFEKEIDKVNFC
ncbi:hypothetical protein AVEN_38399-1 [Araneus ventricosus]|uniref:Uncharacterized protein n=1 Tax=Araneus ventricosus TaxID=182803 RepID=A0A4Y2HC60_ARAVE|nr:hypothetical protein AVEN_38399-1 [Araneus ventricosus]